MRIRSIIITFCLLSSIAVQTIASKLRILYSQLTLPVSQAYADAYPREKAYLHLDNTSYYIGDTIWYKAYVVTAEQNQPSPISTPLYVELLDQLGNTSERQIIQLRDGEGEGQFILTKALFSGFYEIRAYTKWMLAFSEKQYFSAYDPCI